VHRQETATPGATDRGDSSRRTDWRGETPPTLAGVPTPRSGAAALHASEGAGNCGGRLTSGIGREGGAFGSDLSRW
jgi:hypothetical protein